MNIEAVVFDADGTIVDSKEFIWQAFEHSLSKYGHPVPIRSHVSASIVGIVLEDCYMALAPGGDVLALCDTHREFQKNRFDLLTAYEGLDDVVSQLRARGIKLGVCSSRGKTLKPSLNHMDISRHFDVVVDRHDVVNPKPHAEPVLKTLEFLGVSASRAVMIGDTPVDIKAGKAADVACTVGITHGFGTRAMFRDVGADYIIDSLRELPALIA